MSSENSEIYNYQCNNVLSICCYNDEYPDPCSNNWSETVASPWFKTARRKRKSVQPGYDQLLKYNYTDINIMKSWTKSALKEICYHQETNNSHEGNFNCSNTCDVIQDLVFVMISTHNKTCCMSAKDYENVKRNVCSVKNLTVVDGPIAEDIQCLQEKCDERDTTNSHKGSYNCSNMCNVTQELVSVMFSAENKTCCMSAQEYEKVKRGDCSVKNLTVVDRHPTKDVTTGCVQEKCDQQEKTESHTGSFNCSNTCNVTQDLVFVLFSTNNKTCCMSTKEYEQAKKDNCSVRKLTVEDGPVSKNFTLRFCLAAEVINGTLSVAIEECSRYYQSFNISVDREKKIRTKSNTTERSKSITTGESQQTDADAATKIEPFNTVFIAVIVTVSIFVGACVVFGVIVCRKFKKIEKVREKQRPNSVVNRGYAMEVFSNQPQLDDEEYTLISDMEVQNISAEQFIPKLPDRVVETDNRMRDKKAVKESDVITIAEYGVPSDNIRAECKISQTSNYYMTTYDDPIRLKRKEELDNNDKYSCKDDNMHSNGSEFDKRESETNVVHLKRHSFNSNVVDIHNDSAADEKRSPETRAFSLTENNVISGKLDSTQSVKSVRSKQDEDGYEDGFAPLKQIPVTDESKNDGDLEPELENNTSKCEQNNAHDGDDYEDPGLIDGKYRSNYPPSKLFEEHVCLSCLKPEHLTQLGIKIITDDMYEKSKNVQRCLSDPVPRSYSREIDIDGSCFSEPDRSNHPKQKDIADDEQADTLQQLHVEKRKRTGLNTRRCSVCHTIYDQLGNVKLNVWAKCTDNVYDQFGNIKHFQHRKQIGGKRMNSN
ncbi:uncharacterized protein LOC132718050 isoform X2 [Ruditapes philippinarum]|nr:uncharacterized protein LOC132718050 isoform X2 [Ruditapes philippinarum]